MCIKKRNKKLDHQEAQIYRNSAERIILTESQTIQQRITQYQILCEEQPESLSRSSSRLGPCQIVISSFDEPGKNEPPILDHETQKGEKEEEEAVKRDQKKEEEANKKNEIDLKRQSITSGSSEDSDDTEKGIQIGENSVFYVVWD